MADGQDVQIKNLEERLQANPQSLVFARLADLMRKNGDTKRAVQILGDGLAKHPEYATGHLILGSCFLEQKQFDKAIEEYITVCRLDRNHLQAIKTLADIYSKQDMTEKAGDLYAALLIRDPANPSLAHLGRMFSGSGRTDVFEILKLNKSTQAEELSAPVDMRDTVAVANETQPAGELSGEDISRNIDDILSGTRIETGAEPGPGSLDEILKPEDNLLDTVTDIHESGTAADITQILPAAKPSPQAEPSPPSPEKAVVPAETRPDSEDGLTGQDIGSRMDLMFGNETPEEQTAATEVDIQQPVNTYVAPASKGDQDVSGDDVSLRLDDLFGGMEPAEQDSPFAEVPVNPPAVSGTYAQEHLSQNVMSEPVPNEDIMPAESIVQNRQTEELLDTVESALPEEYDSAAEAGMETKLLTGNTDTDITTGSSPVSDYVNTAPQETDIFQTVEAPAESVETIEERLPGLSDTAISDSLDDINDIKDSSVFNPVATDVMPEATEIQPADLADTIPETSAPDKENSSPMSGDDIADRFDMIFTAGEETPPDSILPDSLESSVLPPSAPANPAPVCDPQINAFFHHPHEGFEETEKIHLDIKTDVEPDKTVKKQFTYSSTQDNTEEDIDFVTEKTEKIPLPGKNERKTESVDMPSIPDHVLTPTLADIYLQQGQPHLAAKIYERLLVKDPDNEKLAQRLEKINFEETRMAGSGQTLTADTPTPAWERPTMNKSVGPAAFPRKRKKDPRPLRGVHIKKKIRENLRAAKIKGS